MMSIIFIRKGNPCARINKDAFDHFLEAACRAI